MQIGRVWVVCCSQARCPSTFNVSAAASHYKRLLMLIVCLTIIFCILVLYTNPVHSAIYASTSVSHYSHRHRQHFHYSLTSSPFHTAGSSHRGINDHQEGDQKTGVAGMTANRLHLNAREDYSEEGDTPRRLRVQGTQRRLPGALIIGVRKCGTRALIEMLNLHPDVRKRDAEAHFFDDDDRYMNGLDWYRKKMPYTFDNQITIEKTPSYFVSHEAPTRIHAMNSSVKLLLIVREPAMRVLSDYAQIRESKRAKGGTFRPFHQLVMLPNGEVNDRYNAVQISQYVVHILRWLRVFPREQLHIVDGDMLIHNPYPEIRKIEKFLQLPSKIQASSFYFNRTKGFYCMRNETHQKCLADSKGRRHPYVDPTVMEALRRYFAPFNEQFFQIVGQNFSWPDS